MKARGSLRRSRCVVGTLLVGAMGAVALGVGLRGSTPQAQADAVPVSEFMRKKLEHAQGVLEGLTTENCELIAKNAKAMSVLAQAARWRVYETPEYVHYSTEFQRLTRRLEEQADEGNVDGATLTYVQLTMNCVNCHKHVRSVRSARLPEGGPGVPITTAALSVGELQQR